MTTTQYMYDCSMIRVMRKYVSVKCQLTLSTWNHDVKLGKLCRRKHATDEQIETITNSIKQQNAHKNVELNINFRQTSTWLRNICNSIDERQRSARLTNFISLKQCLHSMTSIGRGEMTKWRSHVPKILSKLMLF